MNRDGIETTIIRLVAAALTGLVAIAGAAEIGSMRMQAGLYAAPYRDAKLQGRLDANTKVTILERRGGWMRVTAADKRSGWVQLYQVRVGEGGGKQASGEGLSMLRSAVETGRSGSHGIVATTGVRGLSAEDLTNAKPNPKAVQSLDAYRATPSAARQEAKSAGLKEHDIPFLKQPEQ